ncbi:transposase [Larkinella arboricola]|uniref:Transposase n=1 Tax=Larkinella arboricola TaxID=643671 RepID=A0A327WFG8_LARAB|nr:transposase [Larkinella arboricola]RAJ89866.1 transposase [Larkinella arboricola]
MFPKPRHGAPRLDWAVFDGNRIILQVQSENSELAIKTTVKLIKALPGFEVAQSVCCIEQTGIYCAHLLSTLYKIHLPICGAARRLESSLQIKKAGGLQRGKSDAIDSVRIAEYGYRFRDKMRLWQPPRRVVQQFGALSVLRQRLILMRQQLQQPLTEQKDFVDSALQKQLIKTCQASLKALTADLEKADEQIDELIQNDPRLKELFDWVTSIPGVGTTTATELLIATDEFKSIDDPKKLACHAGVAPFEHRSGSSIRGRTSVSRHAHKRLKSLFHLGAMSAIRVRGEMQDYYNRKLAEGKNRMVVINAIRNKLIHRICSVVRRGQKYDKNYLPILV